MPSCLVSPSWADRFPVGFYYVSSINDRDYTMIIGTTIFAAALFVVAQLLIDIAYTIFDPRIRIK